MLINKLAAFNLDNIKIPAIRNAIYPFIIIYVIHFAVSIIDYKLGIFKSINNTFCKLAIVILIISTIFISYFWGIKITSFNYKISIRMILFTLFIYSISYLSSLFGRVAHLHSIYDYIIILLNSLKTFIQPAFVEEYIFRGLLISGLLSFGLDSFKTNMLQSLLFGIVHINQYPQLGILCFIPTIAQVLVGFILGKIYLKTNSLTPCIIFHALFDIY
jgi:hypothetical protein